jgi:hypothetical protein
MTIHRFRDSYPLAEPDAFVAARATAVAFGTIGGFDLLAVSAVVVVMVNVPMRRRILRVGCVEWRNFHWSDPSLVGTGLGADALDCGTL